MGIIGPVLPIYPTRKEQRLFLEHLRSQLKPDDEISAIIGYVQAEEVRDIRGRTLPAFAGLTGKAALFFVDRNPDANWGHSCWYVPQLPQTGSVLAPWPLPSQAQRSRRR